MKNIEKNCLILISKSQLDVDHNIQKFAVKPFNIMDINLVYTQMSKLDDKLNVIMKVLDKASSDKDRIQLDTLISDSKGNMYVMQIICALIKTLEVKVIPKIVIETMSKLKTHKVLIKNASTAKFMDN